MVWYKAFFSGLWFVFSLLAKWWGVLSITLLLVIITNAGSINESISEGSILPFLEGAGGELFGHDMRLFVAGEKMSESLVGMEGSVWDKVVSGGVFGKWLAIGLRNVWYLYAWAYLFYWIAIIMFTNNSSAVASNLAVMVLVLVVIQVLAGTLLLKDDKLVIEGEEFEFGTYKGVYYTPFKGLWNFVKVVPKLFTGEVVENG